MTDDQSSIIRALMSNLIALPVIDASCVLWRHFKVTIDYFNICNIFVIIYRFSCRRLLLRKRQNRTSNSWKTR